MDNANNNVNNDFTVTREINQGLNGSGHARWLVFSTWTDRTGRQRSNIETFETLEAAQNWVEWA